MIRVQISMDESLLKSVDSYAKSVGLSRSGFLSLAVSDYLSAKKLAPEVGSIVSGVASLFEKLMRGEISQDEFQTGLDDYDSASRNLHK